MPALTNLQRELLNVFAMNLSDAELLEIRRLLCRYFADKASDELEDFMAEKGITPEEVDSWAFEHNRVNTDRLVVDEKG